MQASVRARGSLFFLCVCLSYDRRRFSLPAPPSKTARFLLSPSTELHTHSPLHAGGGKTVTSRCETVTSSRNPALVRGQGTEEGEIFRLAQQFSVSSNLCLTAKVEEEEEEEEERRRGGVWNTGVRNEWIICSKQFKTPRTNNLCT